MSKHTKGPWSATCRELAVFVPLKAAYCERIGFQIGFVNTDSISIDRQAQANARLIAAAPELLECLSISLELLRNVSPFPGQEDILSGCIEASAAAIAKATGEAK